MSDKAFASSLYFSICLDVIMCHILYSPVLYWVGEIVTVCIIGQKFNLFMLYTSLKVFRKLVYFTKRFDHTTVVFFSGNNTTIAYQQTLLDTTRDLKVFANYCKIYQCAIVW